MTETGTFEQQIRRPHRPDVIVRSLASTVKHAPHRKTDILELKIACPPAAPMELPPLQFDPVALAETEFVPTLDFEPAPEESYPPFAYPHYELAGRKHSDAPFVGYVPPVVAPPIGVPEPGVLSLMGFGLLVFGLWRRVMR